MDNVIRAIAAYERTLFAGRFRLRPLRVRAATTRRSMRRQKRGMQLFFSARAGCAGCHGGINFAGPWVDRDHPRAAADLRRHRHRARRCACPRCAICRPRAPYMHDGRFATLDAVLDHYERLAADPAADPRLRRAPLTTEERAELRKFPAVAGRLALTRNEPRSGVCLRASMHAASRSSAVTSCCRTRPRARPPSGTGAWTSVPSRDRSRPAQADLPARRAISSALLLPAAGAAGAHRRPVAAHLLRSIHRPRRRRANTGSTTSRRRAPGRPITSPRYRDRHGAAARRAPPRTSPCNAGAAQFDARRDARSGLAGASRGDAGLRLGLAAVIEDQRAGAVILGAQTSGGETRFPSCRQFCGRARLTFGTLRP